MTNFSFINCATPLPDFWNGSFSVIIKKLHKIFSSHSENSFKKKLFFQKINFDKINFSLHLQRHSEFIQDFFSFDNHLKFIFPILSNKGTMEISSLDSNDPFLEGIVFSVKPPGKIWKNVSFLSGGEKTLSSLAIVFSLQELKSSLWYLLDEIDAALDFRNVSKISSFLTFQSKNSQILIVSLRNNILVRSKQILGVYKIFGETKLISWQNSF
jgi:structural maintenance of chromosome 4